MSMVDEATLSRFESKVDKSGECWIWTAGRSVGYGRFYFRGVDSSAHRVSYTIYKGTIPEGLHIDHLCRVRACVNPAHLEAVTQRENNRRCGMWETNGENMRRKTHCPQEHPYSGDNLLIDTRGARICRTCKRAAGNRSNAKRRGKVA